MMLILNAGCVNIGCKQSYWEFMKPLLPCSYLVIIIVQAVFVRAFIFVNETQMTDENVIFIKSKFVDKSFFGSKGLIMSGTQAKKLALLEWLAALQDKSLIDELTEWKAAHQSSSSNKEVLKQEEATDFWYDLHPNLQASIDRALVQSAKGEGRPHKEVMDEIRAKYTK